MRALLPLALLLATGCYTPRAIPTESSQPDPYGGWYEAPLEATLRYHENVGYASFQVNRPASVAIFALRPGGGMEMIYPRPGYGGNMQFSSGTHYVRTSANPMRLAGNWSMVHGTGPMYILMVASEDPLDVTAFRFGGDSWFSRTTLTYSPYYAMEALVDEVVRNPSAGRWTTAMQVVWPSGVWPDYNRERYITVRCPNGMVVTIPARVRYLGLPVCPGDEQQAPEEADSTGVEKGEKGTPLRPELPPGWMNTDLEDREMREELRRIRERNVRSGDVLTRQAGLFPPRGEAGGAALGVAARRPLASWPADLEMPRGARAGIWPGIETPPTRQPATRTRPPARGSRPSAEPPAVRRPANNPKPASRPAAQPRSRPDPTPVRPKPRAPEPRPTPSKPKPDND